MNSSLITKNSILSKVYLRMFLGLLVTFATSFFALINPNLRYMVEKWFIVLTILELTAVLVLNIRITKMKNSTATLMFYVYSFLSGLTLTSVLVTYEIYSVLLILLTTLVIFLVMSIYGKTTKEDLSGYHKYLIGALWSLIIVSVINLFLGLGVLSWILSVVGVVLFSALIAYDTNRLVNLLDNLDYIQTDEDKLKIVTIMALMLYLDFINLFLNLIRIFGNRRD